MTKSYSVPDAKFAVYNRIDCTIRGPAIPLPGNFAVEFNSDNI